MNTKVEITHEAFRALTHKDTKAVDVNENEQYRDVLYFERGVRIIVRYSYASSVYQYYIYDINA